ncbi:MAG: stage III sporulation protein AE [Clostridia bacterium]
MRLCKSYSKINYNLMLNSSCNFFKNYQKNAPVSKRKKRLFVWILILISIICSGAFFVSNVLAEDNTSDIQKEISDQTDKQLDNLDISGFDNILKKFTDDEFKIFGASSFGEKLRQIINGDFKGGTENILGAVCNLVFADLVNFLPLMATILAVAIVFSMVSKTRGTLKYKSIGDIIHFVCFGTIVTIIITVVVQMIEMTTGVLGLVKNQIDVAFPILLTLLTAIGGTVSVGVYQPAIALLSGSVVIVFTKILMPIFVFVLIFSVLSNMSDTVKLEKFSAFFSSLFKWIVGAVFTIFFAFLTVQGITAGTYDGISIRTAKFAIKSAVPVIGGYLAEGFNLIIFSSVLIKNAVGMCGFFILLSTILLPLIKLIIFMFCLKLSSAVLEPIIDIKISNFLSSVGKSINLLIVVVLGVAFMYFLLIGLIMCTANVI